MIFKTHSAFSIIKIVLIINLRFFIFKGMKPRMKNHFRAHQLSVWLRLIPELHRAGMEDVVARHNLFRNHNNADLYDGPVRPDPLSRVSYYDPTTELFRYVIKFKQRGMLFIIQIYVIGDVQIPVFLVWKLQQLWIPLLPHVLILFLLAISIIKPTKTKIPLRTHWQVWRLLDTLLTPPH